MNIQQPRGKTARRNQVLSAASGQSASGHHERLAFAQSELRGKPYRNTTSCLQV